MTIIKRFLSHLPLLLALLAPDALWAAQDIRSPINTGGPEDWPEDQGLSTTRRAATQQQGFPGSNPPPAFSPAPERNPLPVANEPRQEERNFSESIPSDEAQRSEPAQTPAAVEERSGRSVHAPIQQEPVSEEPAPEREVIYVDEAGNPVAKPLEPEKMFAEAKTMLDEGKYEDALPVLEQLKALPSLSNELRENVLYGISDAIWARYQDNPLAGYEPIMASTNEALNANLRSPRVPDAMLRLALANINVGNLNEANGYVTGLMRRFPDFPGVAQGLTALGQAQLGDGKNADAEKSLSTVLDKYPESSQLQAASVGLAHALVNQNKDESAHMILDFISKRWPRYYINDPDFLLMQAKNNEKTGRSDEAMSWNWLYVNLDPKRPENAPLLLKMADEYMRDRNADAANFIYRNIQENFPASPAAITSKVRLAERGIHDSPITYAEMSEVFNETGKQGLLPAYNELTAENSDNPDKILAQLKKAMWQYWDKQYPEAMGSAADFIDSHPEHKDNQEARNLLWEAFQKELAQSLQEHNYGRILLLWNGFPYVRERYGKIDPPLRYALAQGWLERGDEAKSFDLLAEFLKSPKDPQYGEAAFSQFFNHYIQTGQWDKILDLGKKVANWKLSPELADQLQYAEALSAQNLNMGAAALNKWREVAHRTDLPLYQQAYAAYFLAKDAEARRDIRNAYELNRKVVEMFGRLADERSENANPERIKEGIASLMDICEVGNRVPEALQWVERYNAFVPEDSPEYPGLRFREARLYRKLGDNSRAHALLEDIASRFPESPFAQAATAELRTFDVSRDLQRYVSGTPAPSTSNSHGSTSGNWSSTAPAQ